MKYGPKNTNGADNPMLPAVVDRAPWQARIDQLPVKEKRTPTPAMHYPRIKAGCDDLGNGAR